MDVHTLASWLPLRARMPQTRKPIAPQMMAGVLQKCGMNAGSRPGRR
jgi:hypothetical protein